MQVIDGDGNDLGYRIPQQFSPSGDYREQSLQEGLEIYRNSFTSGQAWSREFLGKLLPLPPGAQIGIDGYLTAVDRFFGRLTFLPDAVVRYRRHTRNNGPVRVRFDPAYMRERLHSKRTRIAFAEHWLERLGLTYNRAALHTFRDWRLTLMQHCLALLGDAETPVTTMELARVPFRDRNRSTVAAIPIAAALVLVALLPARPALAVARKMLENTGRAAAAQ